MPPDSPAPPRCGTALLTQTLQAFEKNRGDLWVFALLPGGCCQGVVQRIARTDVPQYLPQLWLREMPNPVYDPRWVTAHWPACWRMRPEARPEPVACLY